MKMIREIHSKTFLNLNFRYSAEQRRMEIDMENILVSNSNEERQSAKEILIKLHSLFK